MQRGLNIALRFIRDNPIKYEGEYDDPAEECGDVPDSEMCDEVIKPRPGAAMISAKTDDDLTITVYWDMSYGVVLVTENGEYGEVSQLRLPGVPREKELTPFQQAGLAELGITHVRILRYQLEFAKEKNGNPKLIIIQTIEIGMDTTHGCQTWRTLVYNLAGQLLFEIGGAQEVRNIPGWMNWLLTPDGKWIILWQSDCFQPLFYRISDLEARLSKKNGYHLRVDRLDWVPKISPYTISSITYLPRLPSNHSSQANRYSYEPMTYDEYHKYLQSAGDLDADELLEEDGYLRVYVNDMVWINDYSGTMASDASDGRLGTEIQRGHKSTDIPITSKGQFMIDLLRRRLMPNHIV